MSQLRILHISDLHIGNCFTNNHEDLAISILEPLEQKNKYIDKVVVTGDIFDGKYYSEKNRSMALSFFNFLRKELKKNKTDSLTKSDFIIVPGNHDIKRTTTGINYEDFKTFLKDFYGQDLYEELYNENYLFTSRIIEEKKIAILGLNSCMLENCKIEDKDIKWIEELNNINQETKESLIYALKKQKEKEWDDYGYISSSQLRDSFKELGEKISDFDDYSIVTCFHHHFFPFPEIYSRYGDQSIIRNFTTVIEKFQNNNVKIVLHGHKHLPIIKPLTNQKYLTNPDSIFYIFSSGSASKKDITYKSFQVLDIFSPNEFNKVAKVSRFTYKLEELQEIEEYNIPPQKILDVHPIIDLELLFRDQFYEEYIEYKTDIYETDTLSHLSRIDNVLENISKTITPFPSLKQNLKKSSEFIYIIFLSVHYRINHLQLNQTEKDKKNKFIIKLQNKFKEIFNDSDFLIQFVKLLESDNNKGFAKQCENLLSSFPQYKKCISFSTVAIFFTDLYLTFSKYGELYYKNEKIEHNSNIRLDMNSFHENIPITSILFKSDVDRRLSTIQFKCKNPTVHKISVLIIKDFEKRINKIEDCFKEIGIKIYYISPHITKENYDLDNYNFEAYIPTLLPLLTGENLYKKKDVFIRELIQNSLDAILLRDNITKKNGLSLSKEEKEINITIGKFKNNLTNKQQSYLKIVDHGIGMDDFKVERYFTSIGRSFYVSDEFDELQKSQRIKYTPISNFGIGFLSAFMVCKEIRVITKSFESDFGLDIHIPNYDGCFFIKRNHDMKLNVGTSITLFEDKAKKFKFRSIIKYINETFLDFQLKINVSIDDIVESIPPQILRKDIGLSIFCPIKNGSIVSASWTKEFKNKTNYSNYTNGILINFDPNLINLKKTKKNINKVIYLNSGILLTDSLKKNYEISTPYAQIYYNFPSENIELDVAREKILEFKKLKFNISDIIDEAITQSKELVNNIFEQKPDYPIITLNNISNFFNSFHCSKEDKDYFNEAVYKLSITNTNNNILLKMTNNNNSSQKILTDSSSMIKAYFKLILMYIKRDKEYSNAAYNTFKNRYDALCIQLDDSDTSYLSKTDIQIIEEKMLPNNEYMINQNIYYDHDLIYEDSLFIDYRNKNTDSLDNMRDFNFRNKQFINEISTYLENKFMKNSKNSIKRRLVDFQSNNPSHIERLQHVVINNFYKSITRRRRVEFNAYDAYICFLNFYFSISQHIHFNNVHDFNIELNNDT